MKDLILDFSFGKLINLPPSEFLAVVVLAGLVVLVALGAVVLLTALFDH